MGKRPTEKYPIREDTIQNLAPGEGVIHTAEGWQRGRLYLLDEGCGTLLPADAKQVDRDGVDIPAQPSMDKEQTDVN